MYKAGLGVKADATTVVVLVAAQSRRCALPVVDLRELYLRYGCCMAYVAVERDGIAGIGSAFHIGEGVFLTARHVLDGSQITEIRITDADLFYRSDLYPKREDGSYVITEGSPRMCLASSGQLNLSGGPYFHPDPTVDVAAFRCEGLSKDAHYVPLGYHLDDWIGRGDFELTGALVLGYPPVPFTDAPLLVAARSEVNAVADLRNSKAPVRFLLSAMPRGGFSGGVAISEFGFALGIITESLLSDHKPPELGFFAVTSIECIYDCLDAHKMLPRCQEPPEV